MSFELALIVFLPCLGTIIAGNICLSHRLDELGSSFVIEPGLLGLITALGADSPEISSAVATLFSGEHYIDNSHLYQKSSVEYLVHANHLQLWDLAIGNSCASS